MFWLMRKSSLLFLVPLFLILISAKFAEADGACGNPIGKYTCSYVKQNVYGLLVPAGTVGWDKYCKIICRNDKTTLPQCVGERCTLQIDNTVSCPAVTEVKVKVGGFVCTDPHDECQRQVDELCKSKNRDGSFDRSCTNTTLECPNCKCIEIGPLIEPPVGNTTGGMF